VNAGDRDHAFDRLLRKRSADLTPGGIDECLEPETLAAWMDGGLDAAEAQSAEAHMAACARCQALVATMTRAMSADVVEAVPTEAAEAPWWRINIRWLVPLTAGVTAGLLWTVIPDQQRTVSVVERQSAPGAEAVAPALPPAAEATAPGADPVEQPAPQKAGPAEAPPAPAEAKRADQTASAGASSPRSEAVAEPPPATEMSARKSLPPAAPGAAAAAPPPAPVAEPQAAREAAGISAYSFRVPLVIPTPDAAIQWRINGAAVERTTNGGETWTRLETGHPEAILAGSAPGAEVCWLVGRSGTVLVTTDARTWRRTPAPSSADIVAVSAADELNAVVRTADGEAFRTGDGGATWEQAP
jgi:hypothetical protein